MATPSHDLAAHRRLFPGVRDVPNLAYYNCFLDVVEAIRNCAQDNEDMAEIVFDMRLESKFNAALLYHMTCELQDYEPYLASKISFAMAREVPCIQIADLFAREAMKAVDNHFGVVKRPDRKSWIALHDTGRFHVDVKGEEYFMDISSAAYHAIAEGQTGITRERYVNWLKHTRCLPNTTNYIRFMQWMEKKRGMH